METSCSSLLTSLWKGFVAYTWATAFFLKRSRLRRNRFATANENVVFVRWHPAKGCKIAQVVAHCRSTKTPVAGNDPTPHGFMGIEDDYGQLDFLVPMQSLAWPNEQTRACVDNLQLFIENSRQVCFASTAHPALGSLISSCWYILSKLAGRQMIRSAAVFSADSPIRQNAHTETTTPNWKSI